MYEYLFCFERKPSAALKRRPRLILLILVDASQFVLTNTCLCIDDQRGV